MTARIAAIVVVLLASLAGAARAQAPGCQALEPAEKAMVNELFATLKPYEGCDDTFAKCLAAPKPSPVVLRHANHLCRLAVLGANKAKLEDLYARRKKSMTGTPPTATFALDEAARLGDAQAPVTVVMYACTRCPFCRDLVLALHREVTEDDLKGKVKVYLRPFPLKDHEGSTEGAMALLAAGRLGKLWPYAIYTYKHFAEFHPAVLVDWADFVGLDRAAFEKALADEKLRDALTETKKEGVRNHVEATPTIYIDGRQYVADLEIGSLVDALLEESERVAVAKK
jgi:protein-disulfide isomerase